jgi:hypothetical protein
MGCLVDMTMGRPPGIVLLDCFLPGWRLGSSLDIDLYVPGFSCSVTEIRTPDLNSGVITR